MLEAWALGDAAAIEAAGGDVAKVPAKPESLWGAKRDPQSDYPKHALARALGNDPSSDTTSNVFAIIAEAADPEVIARQCPISFTPFLAEAREALVQPVVREAEEGRHRSAKTAAVKRRKQPPR